MRITEINIPASPTDGLEEIKMSRLGSVVLIAGKNGAGKTRILKKIFETFKLKPKKTELEMAFTNITNVNNTMLILQQQKDVFKEELKKSKDDVLATTRIQSQIKNHDKTISTLQNNLSISIKMVEWHLIETNDQSDTYSSIQYVPIRLDLRDSSSYSKNDMIASAKKTDQVGVGDLSIGTFAKIQVIQDRWFNATHQNSQIMQEEKDKAISDYDKLKTTVKMFLNTDITRTINDEATLFGFPLGQSKLSDGQRVLLQLCIAIYSQEVQLKDLILVMDEPENHLHPSVIIEVLEQIQKCVTNGQIWIATHSVPLLAHFDSLLLWYVEDGKIVPAGKTPESVLRGLLGDDKEIAKLQDFISLPAQFATSKYAFECLFESKTAMTDSSDRQSWQIREELKALSMGGKIKMLDYGVGKGRLISNLLDLDKDNKDNLLQKIEYVAFDKYPKDKDICENNLAKVFGGSEKRYYSDFTSVFSDHDKNSFDIVIMCNVLHEIDPKDWLTLFKPDGEITGCLKENGVLLLVEDCRIPVGEMAYQKGFLVLDTPEIKELFQIIGSDNGFKYEISPDNERLKAHIIPRYFLEQIKSESREKAIKTIASTAKVKIKEIRASAKKDYRNGLLHGFWTQQLANAELNLDELGRN